ncbi:protein THEMIS [Lagopus leucura]|uniref:protein THEMIS n=1 Tax=Lagopus leucura TaxID=30410 RepID=UPI001C665660|nr:protein THEMIS [Lagopus leucura]
MVSTLEKFIHSLDPRALPRVLQIQSGFYFEGSIYEMFGNECCLSTGEVIKVIGFKINKLIASICENNEDSQFSAKVELPLNFPGLYKIVADKTPYVSVEEITRKVAIGPTRFGHPCFYSPEDIKLANLTIKKGEQIAFNSVEEISGTTAVRCVMVRNNQSHSFILPLSQKGKFYECEDDQIYTLKEIAEWKIPKCRSRIVKLSSTLHTWNSSNPLPENFDGYLVLMPVYEVQALMKFRKDVVHILSDLDVEVKDITDCYDTSSFLQPLSLEDVFERTSKEFPIIAEIMDGLSQKPYNLLHTGKEIVIYKKYQATRVIASEIRSDSSKRHFLIPMTYKGKFKRRPREFPTAYDLEIARSEREHLHVVATKAFDSPHAELFSVSVGDQFLVQQCQTSEVLHEGRKKVIDVLACEQILSNAYKKVLLPMYMEGGFVEVIHDKKQYQLSQICKEFHLPFNVKVSVRDLSMKEDVLAAVPGLQLEEEITDSYLLISSASSPMESWEIPVYRLNVLVHLLSKDVQTVVPPMTRTTVEEISEEQYYMVRRYENQTVLPPPRPPKKPATLAQQPVFAVSEQDVSDILQAPKNFCVDTKKKLCSNQDADVFVSCQNDLVHRDNEKDVTGEATLVENRVIKGLTNKPLRKCEGEKEQKEEHDYEYVDENIVEYVRKAFQDGTFCQLYPGLHQKKRGQQYEGGDPASLLCSGETLPGVPHPDVESSAQERQRSVGVRPEEYHKNDPRDGTTLLRGQAERAGVVRRGEEKALERPENGLSVSKGGL